MTGISATNVGAVSFDILSNSGAFTKQVKSAGNSAQNIMGRAMKKVGAAVAAAFSVKVVTAFAKECVELGSDLTEVQNVVDVTFGDSAPKINAWAKTTAKAFGVSELHAKQFSGTMGAMFKSMGLGTDSAYDMSTSLTELAGDIASFYNLDVETAFEKIRSGISGEIMPLRQLGINMSVANLEAYALSQGITQSYNSMTQANQALLRYNYLMSVTADAQGDFSRTSNSWANQTKILKLQFDSLKATLGAVIIQVLAPLLQMLNRIMTAANKAASAIASLFGKKTETVSSITATGNAASIAADSIADTGSAATAAAKKIKRAFAAYDEINVLSSGSNSSAGSGALSTGITSNSTFNTGVDYEGISKETQSFANAIASHFEKISNSAQRVTKSIKQIWENGGRDAFVSLKNIAGNIAEIILIVIGYISELYADIIEWLAPAISADLSSLSQQMDTVNDALEWLKTDGKPILEGIAYTIGIVTAAWAAYKTVQFAATAATKTYAAAQAIVNAVMNANPVGLVVTAIAALVAIIIVCVKHWDEIKAAAVAAWEKTKEAWQKAKDWFNNNVVVPIRSFFTGLWSSVSLSASNAWTSLRNGASQAWSGIKNTFSSVSTFFKTTFTSAWTAVKNVFSAGGKVFDGIKDGIVTSFKTVVNALIKGINTVVKKPFEGLNTVLDKISSIEIAKIKPFSWLTWRATVPQIPMLAEGGWVRANNPQLAIVGDNRREGEIIAPESKITEAVEKAKNIARDVKLMIEVVVNYPDGRRIIKQINQAQLEEGKILLEV